MTHTSLWWVTAFGVTLGLAHLLSSDANKSLIDPFISNQSSLSAKTLIDDIYEPLLVKLTNLASCRHIWDLRIWYLWFIDIASQNLCFWSNSSMKKSVESSDLNSGFAPNNILSVCGNFGDLQVAIVIFWCFSLHLKHWEWITACSGLRCWYTNIRLFSLYSLKYYLSDG